MPVLCACAWMCHCPKYSGLSCRVAGHQGSTQSDLRGYAKIRLGTPPMTGRSTRESTVLWNHRDQIGYSPDDQPLYKRAHCTLEPQRSDWVLP